MAAYYEERVSKNNHHIIVCVPHEKYADFLVAINDENKNGGNWKLESLRPLVKRITKNAISYEDFRNGYF